MHIYHDFVNPVRLRNPGGDVLGEYFLSFHINVNKAHFSWVPQTPNKAHLRVEWHTIQPTRKKGCRELRSRRRREKSIYLPPTMSNGR